MWAGSSRDITRPLRPREVDVGPPLEEKLMWPTRELLGAVFLQPVNGDTAAVQGWQWRVVIAATRDTGAQRCRRQLAFFSSLGGLRFFVCCNATDGEER